MIFNISSPLEQISSNNDKVLDHRGRRDVQDERSRAHSARISLIKLSVQFYPPHLIRAGEKKGSTLKNLPEVETENKHLRHTRDGMISRSRMDTDVHLQLHALSKADELQRPQRIRTHSQNTH